MKLILNGTIETLEKDANWRRFDPGTSSSGTWINAITNLQNSGLFGSNPDTADFSRIVFFFIFMAIIIAGMNFFTSFDAIYPGITLIGLYLIITMLTFINGFWGPGWFYMSGAFSSEGLFGFMATIADNTLFWFLCTMLVIAQVLSNFRRSQR